MESTLRQLTSDILEAVRKEAENQGITQGAIAICFESLTPSIHEWLDLPEGAFSSTYTFPVVNGAEDTYLREDEKEVADCAGVVAMKIAAAKRSELKARTNSYAAPTRKECTSGGLDKTFVCDGRINWKGCVLYPLGVLAGCGGPCGNMGYQALNVYVAVSGGTEDQDEAAAWAALSIFQKFPMEHLGFILQRNFFDD